jgi:glycosyltransferase involved in cell wall biosynthesis
VLDITPLIITYNEAANVGRILAKLSWARRIVVVDSGSTDGTLEILKSCPRVHYFHHEFTDFASQCNFGLTKIETEWALSIDADYELSDQLISELEALTVDDAISGLRARFVYRIHGRPLRGTLYPPRVVLYRRDRARYRNEGHGHRVEIIGKISDLVGVIYHDDRKPLSRWFSSQRQYVQDEVRYLLGRRKCDLSLIDKVRLLAWPAPGLVLFYTLVAKRCALDGWAGWHYALQRVCFEVMLALEISEDRLAKTIREYNGATRKREKTQ